MNGIQRRFGILIVIATLTCLSLPAFASADDPPLTLNSPAEVQNLGDTYFSWEVTGYSGSDPLLYALSSFDRSELWLDGRMIWDCIPWVHCSSLPVYENLSGSEWLGTHHWQVKAFNGDHEILSDVRTLQLTPDTDLGVEGSRFADHGTSARHSVTFIPKTIPAGYGTECRLDDGGWQDCTGSFETTGLVDGPHTLQARATDDELGTDPTPSSFYWTVDTHQPPFADLQASEEITETGVPVTLDASSSSNALDGGIVSWEFDPEGDGTYTAPSTTKSITHTYETRGTYPTSVRVTNQNGLQSVKTIPIEVRLAQPSGLLGVTINDGARFTNDPEVTIDAVWPKHALDVIISNDGGFQDPLITPVDSSIPWTLDSSGSERIPKTIYVRFTGGASGAETYQDDIILDETSPSLLSAKIGGKILRLKARDRTSGVGYFQTAVKKSKPSKKVSYRRKVRITGAKPKFVRVQDRAGNFSKWKTIKKPRKRR